MWAGCRVVCHCLVVEVSDIPLSEHAPPPIEPAEPATYPLGPEFLNLMSHMAATMLPGLVGNTDKMLQEDEAVALSVRLAVGIANELRQYRLMYETPDTLKAVKVEKKDENALK